MSDIRPSLDMSDPDQRELAGAHTAKDRWYDWETEVVLSEARIECSICAQTWPCETKISLQNWLRISYEEMNKLDSIDIGQGINE